LPVKVLTVVRMAFERAKYLMQFKEEAGHCARNLVRGLTALSRSVGDTGLLRAMARDVHTLRGSATMMGCESLAACARLLEERLEATVQEGAPVGKEQLGLLAGDIDRIRQSIDDAMSRMEKGSPTGRERTACGTEGARGGGTDG
jgi:chemotaxis protein histidine kinase CheA